MRGWQYHHRTWKAEHMGKKSSGDILTIIKHRVADGVLLPGGAINEREIADEFSVSRTPVREALLQLAVLGFVVIVPRSGIFVSKLAVRELLAMLETLASLEGLCLSLVAERIDGASMQSVIAVHAEAEQAVKSADAAAYTRCNKEFHDLLYRTCRNEFLVGQIDLIRSRTAMYRPKRFDMVGGLRRSWLGHGQMIEAVLGGDKQAAYDLAVEHIAMGGREFAEVLNRSPDDFFSNGPIPSHAQTTRKANWPFQGSGSSGGPDE